MSPVLADPLPMPCRHQCDRFFFAIRPDAETAAAIDAFVAREVPEGRRLPLAHQHVTLALTEDFADYPAGVVERLVLAGEEVKAASFEMRLTCLSASRHSVALCLERLEPSLIALQRAIAAAMTRQGVAMREGWRFNPHQTLCYRKGEAFTRMVEGFTWHVREFVLVRSLVGLSRHELVGCWPLGSSGVRLLM
ncbi:MAG: 2'-5' RNA ligase [Sphingomonadales bacterium]|nr:MAG: 2'-5' RNA ligase [Sphingomonadales bacterium]